MVDWPERPVVCVIIFEHNILLQYDENCRYLQSRRRITWQSQSFDVLLIVVLSQQHQHGLYKPLVATVLKLLLYDIHKILCISGRQMALQNIGV